MRISAIKYSAVCCYAAETSEIALFAICLMDLESERTNDGIDPLALFLKTVGNVYCFH